MKVIKKRLDDLKHPEKNVRIHSEQQIRELKRSLEKFGQTRALVVDENNVILIGNGLYEAMVSLGYQEASVYVKTELSENDKKKLMIADNKTYALGIDNLDTLNEFLEELQGDLDIPGYDEEILQQMVADADEVTEKISEYGALDESEIQKIKEANEKREQRDYRQELIHLFNHMDVFFDTPHKRHVAERYRNFFMAVSAIATSADCKHIYEGLISGDPKMRAFRALYQRVYGRYINDAKKGEHHGQ